MPAERVAIFIDGSNFYHSVKDTFQIHDNQVDFSKLVEALKKGRLLIGVYYYNAPLDRGYTKKSIGNSRSSLMSLEKYLAFM